MTDPSGAQPDPSPRPKFWQYRKPGLKPEILLPLIIATTLFMEQVDNSALAIALPVIAMDLDQSPLTMRVALLAYLLSLVVVLPASGWLADRFSARTIFRLAIALFISGSITCGVSQTLEHLVTGRLLQGTGGALMVPVGRLIILQSVARGAIVRAFALLAIPALCGPIVGPLLGGFVSTFLSWRWVFWINVPVALVAFYASTLFLPPGKPDWCRPFDWPGYLLIALGFGAVVVSMSIAGFDIVPDIAVFGLMIAGFLLLIVYWQVSRHRKHPVLDLKLFRLPTFSISVIGGTIFRLSNGALPFLLPMLFQLGFGMSAFEAGSITFVLAFGAVSMKVVAPRILRAFGFKYVLVVNSLICGVLMAAPGFFRPEMPVWIFIVVLGISGFFRSLHFTSSNTLAYADVELADMSGATALTSIAQQIALGFGITVGALALQLTTPGVTTFMAQDFQPAFIVIGVIAALSMVPHFMLKADAGRELSGKSI